MVKGSWYSTQHTLAMEHNERTSVLIRLLCPWHFPGENTGVGCHYLLQGIFPTQAPGSPEGNTEGPGTASSEPLLPS